MAKADDRDTVVENARFRIADPELSEALIEVSSCQLDLGSETVRSISQCSS